MARVWKIVRHGAPDQWEDSYPEESLAEGQLVGLLSRLAASHLPSASRSTTSLTVKNDRFGNKRLIMYAAGSRVHYIATSEETPEMPTGPKGEKRPADVIGNAVKVMRIATGEEEETGRDPAKEFHRKGGLKGGKARAKSLSSEQRSEIASRAAAARWRKD